MKEEKRKNCCIICQADCTKLIADEEKKGRKKENIK